MDIAIKKFVTVASFIDKARTLSNYPFKKLEEELKDKLTDKDVTKFILETNTKTDFKSKVEYYIICKFNLISFENNATLFNLPYVKQYLAEIFNKQPDVNPTFVIMNTDYYSEIKNMAYLTKALSSQGIIWLIDDTFLIHALRNDVQDLANALQRSTCKPGTGIFHELEFLMSSFCPNTIVFKQTDKPKPFINHIENTSFVQLTKEPVKPVHILWSMLITNGIEKHGLDKIYSAFSKEKLVEVLHALNTKQGQIQEVTKGGTQCKCSDAFKKIKLEGRLRNVYRIGNKHYTRYHGSLVPLSDLKKLGHKWTCIGV